MEILPRKVQRSCSTDEAESACRLCHKKLCCIGSSGKMASMFSFFMVFACSTKRLSLVRITRTSFSYSLLVVFRANSDFNLSRCDSSRLANRSGLEVGTGFSVLGA